MIARAISFFVFLAVCAAPAFAAVGTKAEEAAQSALPAAQKFAPAPALSPEEEMRTFQLPPGFRVELVAAEPMVHDPVAAAFDLEGNLWVAEFSTYNGELTTYLPGLAKGIKPADVPKCKIVKLESTHHDGHFDRRTVWLDGLEMVRGIALVRDGVLVSDSPNLWLARDLHGVGRCDDKVRLADNYSAVTMPQVSSRQSTWAYKPTAADTERKFVQAENSGSLLWGRDNVIHNIDFAFDYRYQHGAITPVRVPVRGQFGIAQDDFGRLFFNSNSDHLRVDLFAPTYSLRNPHATEAPWANVRIAEDQEVWPSHPTPAITGGYRRGILGQRNGGLRDDGTLQEFTAACSPLIYRGTNFPADFYGNAFVPEPAGNFIRRDIVRESPGRLSAANAYQQREFLASTDSRFRPVALLNAPDGSLLVIDMYRGVLQEYHYLTHYLESQSLGRGLETPMLGQGRIFRIVYAGGPLERARPDLARRSAVQLVELLARRNAWWRETAQQALVERGDLAAVPALRRMSLQGPDDAARVYALWTLDGLEATTPELLDQALADPSAKVRAAAVRLHERWLQGDDADDAVRRLAKHLRDPEPEVAMQIAFTLGEARSPAAVDALIELLLVAGAHVDLPAAIATGLNGREYVFFERLMTQTKVAAQPEIAAMVGVLSAAIVHRGDQAEISRLVARASDRGGLPRPLRLAVLQGLQSLTRPAFRRSMDKIRVMSREDLAPLIASTDSEVSDRAKKLADALGRDAEQARRRSTAARPLNNAERKLYEQGSAVFQVCAACHQPTGIGQPGVAPSLVDSRWLEAPSEVLVRIVLNGKEGTPGFTAPMPPIGGTFTDEQIAGVLTYVRNSWGLQLGAVATEAVAKVRKENASRQAPWTNDELQRLEGSGRRGRR